jgi:hypothetical protein
VDVDYAGRSDWNVVVEEEYETRAAFDDAVFDQSLGVDRPFELSHYGIGTKLRMAGDADGAPTKAFDPIMPAHGFHIDERAWL